MRAVLTYEGRGRCWSGLFNHGPRPSGYVNSRVPPAMSKVGAGPIESLDVFLHGVPSQFGMSMWAGAPYTSWVGAGGVCRAEESVWRVETIGGT